MEKMFAIVGIAIFIGIAFLFSSNKKEINWKGIGCAFLGQILLALAMIKTPLWKLVQLLANGITWVLNQANEGIGFVFGGLVPHGGFVFFINSLLPIVFISALIGILFHFGILQKFIALIGNTIARVLRVDTTLAVNGVGNMFLGQSEALFLTKQQLPKASESVIFGTLVAGMGSISASVVGLYVGYGASMEWILVSLPLGVLSTLIFTQILMPTKFDASAKVEIESDDKGANVIETMMNYANAGFKSVIGITVALIVFLSVIALTNNFIGLFFDGITLQSILGLVFTPLAFLMGVPAGEVSTVAQILATKFITNEAVAFGLPQFTMLSVNAKAMITVALCGFAGIGSIGILMGGYSAIAPNKLGIVAKLGMKALLTATIVNMFTGAIVGLML